MRRCGGTQTSVLRRSAGETSREALSKEGLEPLGKFIKSGDQPPGHARKTSNTSNATIMPVTWPEACHAEIIRLRSRL